MRCPRAGRDFFASWKRPPRSVTLNRTTQLRARTTTTRLAAHRFTYEVGGAKLTEADVIQRAVSVDAVRALVSALNKSFYSWERALEPLVRRAGEQEVLQLAELFAESERSSLVHSLLA